jgi:hypothetical protein
MDTTGSDSTALSSVKRKNDNNWGGAHEGAGRKKKTISTSRSSQPEPLGPSTQSLSAGNSRLTSLVPLPVSHPEIAAVGFFAPRQPSIYRPASNSNVLVGSSSVANLNQANAGPQGARISPEQGALTIYCVIYYS